MLKSEIQIGSRIGLFHNGRIETGKVIELLRGRYCKIRLDFSENLLTTQVQLLRKVKST